MTSPEMLDPRSRRSRAALQGALLDMLEQDAAREVTVATLTTRAGVNRSTFYQHYRDVGQLLAEALLTLAAEVGADLRTLPRPSHHAPTPMALHILFEHTHNRRALYCAALNGPGSGTFLQQLLECFAGRAGGPVAGHASPGAPAPGAAVASPADRAAAGALLAGLLVWLAPSGELTPGVSATVVADWAWAAARHAATADTTLLRTG